MVRPLTNRGKVTAKAFSDKNGQILIMESDPPQTRLGKIIRHSKNDGKWVLSDGEWKSEVQKKIAALSQSPTNVEFNHVQYSKDELKMYQQKNLQKNMILEFLGWEWIRSQTN